MVESVDAEGSEHQLDLTRLL